MYRSVPSSAWSGFRGWLWAGLILNVARAKAYLGDLWMWLQLMGLQFEVVRGPVGVVWGRCGASLWHFGRKPAPSRPQATPTGLRTTSKRSHMNCSHIHPSSPCLTCAFYIICFFPFVFFVMVLVVFAVRFLLSLSRFYCCCRDLIRLVVCSSCVLSTLFSAVCPSNSSP
jgi:hypothetical protein